MAEGEKFQRINYPDPHGFGDEYRPVFPPRHKALKAVLDNLPESVEAVYVFGSSIRWDSAVNSDLDLFLIGNPTAAEMNELYRHIPEDEKVDILTETREAFTKNLSSDWTSLYRKVYEGGYKIYEREKR
ncbi:MAG: nucleotidyltransferase domain-containing protein [Syntrophomonadaceae bacterium]|jgi:predicted nucleotidyltransferase|nr:nucleotidyltransferase domain-containing protein [Syntrophomonadaceae bacterium]